MNDAALMSLTEKATEVFLSVQMRGEVRNKHVLLNAQPYWSNLGDPLQTSNIERELWSRAFIRGAQSLTGWLVSRGSNKVQYLIGS